MTAVIGLEDVGLVCNLGRNCDEISTALRRGERGYFPSTDKYSPGTNHRVGMVSGDLPELPDRLREYTCRNNQLLVAAAVQIIECVEKKKRRFGKDRVGLILGTSTSGIAAAEHAQAQALRGETTEGWDYETQRIGSGAQFLSRFFGITGPCWSVSTACSSAAKAISAAARLIKSGACDAVLAGGADSLCRLTLQGFSALASLTTSLSNPFGAHRDGINIGEGSALLLLSREPAGIVLSGWGESSDAHHISAPAPDGRGAAGAMKLAMEASGFDATEIDYINLHGTGTLQNDRSEHRAVAHLFRNRVRASSTKSMTGHTLGVSGALELGLCMLALRNGGYLPPHICDDEIDPELGQLDLLLPPHHLNCSGHRILSNSFAFGGNNISLIIEGQ